MKNLSKFAIAAGLYALPMTAHSAVVLGDVIGVDFGGPTSGQTPASKNSVNPTNNFNLVNSTTIVNNLGRTSDAANTGASVKLNGTGMFFNGDPNDSVVGTSGTGFNLSNVTDWTGNGATGTASWNFVFTGLNDSLTYDLVGVIGGFVGAVTDNTILTSGTTTDAFGVGTANPRFATLSGLSSAGGSLTVTVSATGTGTQVPVLSAATLTAVPEPSAVALLGAGLCLGLLRRRR